jgi:hypothetical protein
VSDPAATKERWLRRVVARQGYRLRKQRRRDRTAYDYGKFRIFDQRGNLIAGDPVFGMTLAEAEAWCWPDAHSWEPGDSAWTGNSARPSPFGGGLSVALN